MKDRQPQLVAAAGGLALALAGPPTDVYPGLWIGMAALAWCLGESPRWPAFASHARVALTGARRGLLFGAVANVGALRFIPGVVARFTPLPWAAGALGLLLLAAFEATRWAVACVACETLVRARVPRPLAFAAGVYGGSFVPTMLPWTVAGGVSPWPAMIQLAELTGERGVAAVMALAAGLIAAGVRELRASPPRATALLGSAAALVALQAGLGVWRIHTLDASRSVGPSVRVALVQPGIGPTTRWDAARAPGILQGLTSLTLRAEGEGAELVIWPEAAYPYPLEHGVHREPPGVGAVLQGGVHGPVLTGLITTDRSGQSYNSALVATRGAGLSESYDKRHLLWFGETVPLADRVPWLRRVFARGLGLAQGEREVTLTAGRIRAAVLICYEDVLPEAGREAMAANPNLLVNVTNDAWFDPPESELHLRMAALRAVEARRDLVRAVNGGISAWFDAAGRLRARGAPDFPGLLTPQPTLREGAPTLYARHGDAPWALLALLLANAAVWSAARRLAPRGE